MELRCLCLWQRVLLRLRLALEVRLRYRRHQQLNPQKLLYEIQQVLNWVQVLELTCFELA